IDGSVGRERSELVTSHRRRGLLPSRKSGYIGGGWQLAWKSSDVFSNGQVQDCMDRVYLHEGVPKPEKKSSLDNSTDCKFTQATALVNKSVFHKDQFGSQNIDLHSSEKNLKGTKWGNLLEPGVKRALIAGVGIQLLQQFAGINGILYYTPQILDQAGVGVLISSIGLSSTSASILMSALTTLLMLPFIGIAMWLIDRAGRRKLLLVTIPILVLALLVLIVVNIVDLSVGLHAALSTTSVIVYFCIFVMGFGPIPNIFCSEIFPARVRAICSAICSLTFWISDIIVTYTLPLMMSSLGFTGVFGLYAIVCILAMLFVYMRVPETRGMPLEVIAEFYALGPYWHADQKQKGDTKDKESEETFEAL
ncbi:monosaccharide-sensing protein 2-like, partial [Lolium rigidum]|uniref:monosaccharide-sensing protein 2-like n=1 Tax=Lolium rigidum TaxID=89674 RepID=UPI001F5E2E36